MDDDDSRFPQRFPYDDQRANDLYEYLNRLNDDMYMSRAEAWRDMFFKETFEFVERMEDNLISGTAKQRYANDYFRDWTEYMDDYDIEFHIGDFDISPEGK